MLSPKPERTGGGADAEERASGPRVQHFLYAMYYCLVFPSLHDARSIHFLSIADIHHSRRRPAVRPAATRIFRDISTALSCLYVI